MKSIIASLGVCFFCVAVHAQSRLSTEIFPILRNEFPHLASNEIAGAVGAALWNSNRTAVALSLTNALTNGTATRIFVLVDTGSAISVVGADVQADHLHRLAFPQGSAYDRAETAPVRWIPWPTGEFLVIVRTRIWKGSEAIYSIEAPLVVDRKGRLWRDDVNDHSGVVSPHDRAEPSGENSRPPLSL